MVQRVEIVPARLRERLADDSVLNGYIDAQIGHFAPWFKASGLPFFPEYTDHGLDHITRILNVSEWLIDEGAWEEVAPQDVACLVLAVLLHDAAMHITADAFFDLVEHSSPVAVPLMDSVGWHELWSAYQIETKHWDEKTWAKIAGRDYADRIAPVAGQPYLIERKRLAVAELPIVGEFIRRHHGRLAHEFALGGVAALTFDAPPDDFDIGPDLAGLIARSHAMGLRDTYAYLDATFAGRIEVGRAHPVFLMTLLRVADYLDLHAERAPKDLLRVKQIRSKLSEGEWRAHQAVREIRYDTAADPELVEIIAHPRNAFDHERITQWVSGIQSELDQSWAVLGELFGRHGRLRVLKLRLRRITAPTLDAATVARFGYSPPLARLRLESIAMLRLLVTSLYGDRPEVAVRELMQNGVDAVNEARMLHKKKGTSPSHLYPVLTANDADVVVSVNERDGNSGPFDDGVPPEWDRWLEVVDRGTGMTEEIIRNFFLNVGASFRNSVRYNQQFSPDEQAAVLRSGRFGIGVLASFLCGNEMRVDTRHLSSDTGSSFVCALGDDGIELRRTRDLPIGTRVRVRLSDTAFQALTSTRFSRSPGSEKAALDWFVMKQPRVHTMRRKGSDVIVIDQAYEVPDPSVRSTWRAFAVTTPHPYTVQWMVEKDHPHCDIHVNGFFVETMHYQDFRAEYGKPLRAPAVNVIDPSGRFPLTLTRDRVHGRLSCAGELIDDMLRDHIAWLFLEAGIEREERAPFAAPAWSHQDFDRGDGDASSEFGAYLMAKDGIVPLTSWHLGRAGVSALAAITGKRAWRSPIVDLLAARIPVLFHDFTIHGGFREPHETVLGRYLLAPFASGLFNTHSGVLLARSATGALAAGFSSRRPSAVVMQHDVLRVEVGTGSSQYADLERIYVDAASGPGATLDLPQAVSFTDVVIEPDDPRLAHDVGAAFGVLWDALGLPPVIPYDAAARARSLDHSGGRLTPYLERHATMIEAARGIRIDPWWQTA